MASNHQKDTSINLKSIPASIASGRTWLLLVLIGFGIIYIGYCVVTLYIIAFIKYSSSIQDIITPMTLLLFSYWFQLWILLGLYNLQTMARYICIGFSTIGIVTILVLFSIGFHFTTIPGLPGQIGFLLVFSLFAIYVLVVDESSKELFSQLSIDARNIEQFMNQPDIANFIYNTTVIMFGYLLIKMQVKNGLPFTRSIFVLIFYLLAILFLKPMDGALMDSDPFANDLIEEIEAGIMPETID